MAVETERDRGVLSPADRAYLRGDREYGSVQAERNARARIRRRAFDALLDFELLVERLPERDRELLLSGDVAEAGTDGFDALVSAMAFCYEGAERAGVDFETVLREAVSLAEAREDRGATVRLDVTYHALDADQLLAKLESDESLSLTEIAYLYESDAVGREELAAQFERDEGVDDGRVQAKVTDY
jgi:hypothetical protein